MHTSTSICYSFVQKWAFSASVQSVFAFIIPFCVETRLLVRSLLQLNVFIVTTLSFLPCSPLISLSLVHYHLPLHLSSIFPFYLLIVITVSFPIFSKYLSPSPNFALHFPHLTSVYFNHSISPTTSLFPSPSQTVSLCHPTSALVKSYAYP